MPCSICSDICNGGVTMWRAAALDKNSSKDFKWSRRLTFYCMHAIMFMRYSTRFERGPELWKPGQIIKIMWRKSILIQQKNWQKSKKIQRLFLRCFSIVMLRLLQSRAELWMMYSMIWKGVWSKATPWKPLAWSAGTTQYWPGSVLSINPRRVSEWTRWLLDDTAHRQSDDVEGGGIGPGIKITHSESRGTWFTVDDFRFMMQLACAESCFYTLSGIWRSAPITSGRFDDTTRHIRCIGYFLLFLSAWAVYS